MRTPLKVARIIKAFNNTLSVPVTAKIRLGWQDCQNGLQLSRIIEAYGGSLVAVHARSKEQGHEGKPDLESLAVIKKALSIPVIGNGGIRRVSDIDKMIKITNCDGVMIGRGALFNPWIFSGRDREEITPSEVQDLLLEHLGRSLSFYGEEDGLMLFRKFAAAYLKPYQLAPDTRQQLLTETDSERFKERVREIIQETDS